MRTHEEYKAEVLRRAESCRKKQKKNRVRILTACVCLLLICGTGYMMLPRVDVYQLNTYQTVWPDLYNWLTSPSIGSGLSGSAGGIPPSSECPTPPSANVHEEPNIMITCVKIFGYDDCLEVVELTETHELKKLCKFLQTAIADSPTDSDLLGEGYYDIVFITDDGNKKYLFLDGNRLSCNGQHPPVYLSEQMLKEFKQIIGE